MLLSQRPLTGSPVDAALFVGRHAERERIHRAVGRGQNVMVRGQRRSGKTSLLRLVAAELVGRGRDIHWVDGQTVGSSKDLVDQVVDLLPGATRSSRGAIALAALGRFEREPARPLGASDVSALTELPPVDPEPVVIIDDLQGSQGHDLFGRFRDQVWQAPIRWLASTGDRQVIQPPADVFWEALIDLGGLTAVEVDELVARRLATAEPGDADARRLSEGRAQLARQYEGRLPGEVVAGMHAFVDGDARRVVPGSPDRREAAKDAAGSSAVVVLDALEVLDRPVHAGDTELGDAAGISRARISQLLNALEDAGLVRSFDQSRRKMYEPVPLP